MRYFAITKVIDKDFLPDFFDFINQDGPLTILIESVGGSYSAARLIVNILNTNADRITLIGATCYSAAFQIFYTAKCKKWLIQGAMGMIHLPYTRVDIDTRKKPVFTEGEYILKNDQFITAEYVKEFMTKSELRRYKSGKDVYFVFDRMREIFPEAEII